MTLQETYQQAIHFHQNGQLAEAEKLYLDLLESSPRELSIYPNLADVLIRQGKTGNAIEQLEIGRSIDKNDPRILLSLSSAHAQSGQIDMAFEFAKEAVQLSPEAPEAQYQLGNLFLQTNNIKEAKTAFVKTIELNPEMAYAWYNIGHISYLQGEAVEAMEAYQKALAYMPDLLPAYLNLGTILSELGRYDEALENYQTALKLNPDYVNTHQGIGMVLHITGQLVEAANHFRKALDIGGRNGEILLLLAHVHRDLNQPEEAARFYNEVLDIAPQNETAKSNLRKLQKHKISSWHLEMLADEARNEAYDKALRKVCKDKVVLDIGTGSGLLAMMAARAGAEKVYAIEMIPVLAETAEKIIATNGFGNQIKVINKKSTALKPGEDLKEQAQVLVTEILDAGLLGEGVLPTHRHALESLMHKDAIVVPQAAEIHGVLIQSTHHKTINPVRKISGFDLSIFDEFRVPEEYSRVLLNTVPHKKLSDTFSVLSVDFKALPKPASESQPNTKELMVKIKEGGVLHGIAFWFRLDLDAEISLSSGPYGDMIHWGQALYFFNQQKEVKSGDEVNLKVLQSDTKIWFSI